MNNVIKFRKLVLRTGVALRTGDVVGLVLEDKKCDNNWCTKVKPTQPREECTGCCGRSYHIKVLDHPHKQWEGQEIWLCGINIKRLSDEEAAVYLL